MKINFSTISERLADAFSEREALVNIERGRRYTFREFHLLTNRIVNMMRHKLDLQRGDNAVIILDNDNASLLHFFTAAKAGTPLCYTNYRDSLDDHTYQVDTVSAKVVFIEADLLESHYDMLRERQVTIVAMDKPEKEYQGVHYFWNLLEQVDDSNPNVVIDDRDDVVIMRFTGGTTGRGKCAMYTADTYLACRDSYWALPDPAWNPETRFIHLAPITHGSGMMFAPTQFKGGCTVTMNVPDLDAWCDNIAAERITNGFAVPTLLYRLLDMDEKGRARFKTIENMYYGAAPMSPSKLAELQAAFGNNFIQVYGSTEHFGVALSMSKADHLVEDGDDSHLASAGRPAPFTELEIMDDDGNPVPRGETGEIWLRSRAIVPGYFGNPEQTASEFQDGFWKSGDIGRIDERGFFHIVDRKKDMIIVSGFNVFPNEIEDVVSSHPKVVEFAAVGVPDSKSGEAVKVYLVPTAEGVTENELKEFCRERLTAYKVPKQFEFRDELPKTNVGKILRRELRDEANNK